MSSNMITKTILIDNMTCVNCENIIEQELSRLEGIAKVKASYSAGMATITYDENVINLEKIEQVLLEHDYYVKKSTSKEFANAPYTNIPNSNSKTLSSGKVYNTATNKIDFTNVIAVAIIIFALYTVANRFGLLNIFNTFPVAKDGMGYGMLFLIGVLTSVHCVAMCGGICLSQCVPKNPTSSGGESKFAAMRPSLLYNLGRVISYTAIGAVVGAIGSVVSFSGTMKGIVQILAGVFMVIMGLNMLNIFPWLRKFNPRMPKIFAKKIYAQRSSNSPLYIGLLNGLMPCGPLQAMQLYALSTGSPIKGAVSMFLFSVGTVPLMFAFGALSSFLSKKFTSKMLTASAILVVVLGVFMFNNGIGLSGITLPSISPITSSAQTGNVATLEDGVQVVTTSLSSGRYEPIVVQKGIPVKWTIQAEDGDINGCNNKMIIQKYNIQKQLVAGNNVIEFTPTDTGVVPYSCWMGMIRSKITVVDDLKAVDNSVVTDSSGVTESTGGSCCAGGASTNSADTSSNTNGAGSNTSGASSNASGLDDYNNLLDVQIPTDNIAIAKVEDGIQTVDITYDGKGFSPAVVVVQGGLETTWTINGIKKDMKSSNLLFPYYSAQLEVLEGKNPINFIPDQDFDFYSADSAYYGYVKVVDDINKIDVEAIKKEVSEYKPSAQNNSVSGTGGASCCQ
ncbi:MAG: Heavy metal transporter [Herbinix sp.]|jgi:sulfite exporter TauE/SafE/copper chaperone CopZ/plastocyanin domain-containing protein|nr:Heavy metal transporter [Herbinix sp.]